MSMLVSTQSSVAVTLVNAPLASQLTELFARAVTSLDRDMATARGCIAEAAGLLSVPIASVDPITTITRGGLAKWQMQRLAKYVDHHLDKTIAIEDMAAVARLSCSYFSKAFSISFGRTPHAYVIERRVDRAKHLMLDGNASLAEISLDCGFADQAHFCRLFKRITGETANVWRRARLVDQQLGQSRVA